MPPPATALAEPAQADQPPPRPAPDVLATLERTGCLGTCPIYKVTIHRNGVVDWEGTDYVDTIGPAGGHLRPGQLGQIDELLRKNGYLQLRDRYTARVTDNPWVITSYAPSRGRFKRVEHYLGDRTAPAALRKIEDGMDQIAATDHWIGHGSPRRSR